MQQVSSGFFKTFSFLLIVAFLSSGCAKFSYLVEQGIGQLKLQSRSKKNSEILKDPTVEESIKDKIKLITKYKEYFYRYWGKPSTGIYSKTTILKGEAVTHLVIVSPADKIEALEECFPLVGCFPYLGFFKKASAKEYASKKSAEGFVTYTRPVYAYSTLGKLEDRILSSFFQYKDSELAELIFHELFHTIFFIKDEVELNENLANYFGQVMAYEYFKLSKDEIKAKMKRRNESALLSSKIVILSKQLNQVYSQHKNLKKGDAKKLLDRFMIDKFKPYFEKFCSQQKISYCYPLKRSWNNASLAALLTYERKADQVKKLQGRLGHDLKQFFGHIEKEYQEFKDSDSEGEFSDYLFKENK